MKLSKILKINILIVFIFPYNLMTSQTDTSLIKAYNKFASDQVDTLNYMQYEEFVSDGTDTSKYLLYEDFIKDFNGQKVLSDKELADTIIEIKIQISIVKKRHNISNDSLTVELLNKIAVLLKEKSKDSSLFYANKALLSAKKLNINDLIAVSYYNIANINEQYNETDLAEKNYLEWYKIRKEQDDMKYRWAMSGMRKFYSKHKQIEKLEKIEDEWVLLLDKQYENKFISHWMPSYDQSPDENYRLSLYPVLFNLVDLNQYLLAEKYFIHMIKKCVNCSPWINDDMIYFRAANQMLSQKDTSMLSVWYEHWFNTLQNFSPSKEIALNTFKWISEKYIGQYQSNPEFGEKYYHKMLNYTFRVGGDSAVYKIIEKSMDQSLTDFETIKLNLIALQICLKTKDNINLEKHYQALNLAIRYIDFSNKDSTYKIKRLLSQTIDKTNDLLLKNWCIETLKKFY